MKNALAAGLLALSFHPLAAAAEDRAAVEAVVRDAYVQGVHARPDAAAMRRGFHPDFRMLVLREGRLQALSLEEWAARVEKAAAERKPDAPAAEVRADFASVDVTGDAAVVRLELHRDGRHVFTDYLSLYRFPEGWRIVGKTFQDHRR
jgi:ketosteroid isomerase-like protein